MFDPTIELSERYYFWPKLETVMPLDTRYVCSKLRFTGLGVLSSIGGALGLYLGFSLLDGHRVVSLLLAQATAAARGARMCFK